MVNKAVESVTAADKPAAAKPDAAAEPAGITEKLAQAREIADETVTEVKGALHKMGALFGRK